jgi:hypothetical protein
LAIAHLDFLFIFVIVGVMNEPLTIVCISGDLCMKLDNKKNVQ